MRHSITSPVHSANVLCLSQYNGAVVHLKIHMGLGLFSTSNIGMRHNIHIWWAMYHTVVKMYESSFWDVYQKCETLKPLMKLFVPFQHITQSYSDRPIVFSWASPSLFCLPDGLGVVAWDIPPLCWAFSLLPKSKLMRGFGWYSLLGCIAASFILLGREQIPIIAYYTRINWPWEPRFWLVFWSFSTGTKISAPPAHTIFPSLPSHSSL